MYDRRKTSTISIYFDYSFLTSLLIRLFGFPQLCHTRKIAIQSRDLSILIEFFFFNTIDVT